jgi:hypothetical protein
MQVRAAGKEGRRAMGMGDRIDVELEDRKAFLRQLIGGGHLDRPALGITRQVIDRGEASLSQIQKRVFKLEVLDVFVTAECKGCGSNVLWSEMYPAYHNGGYCAHCANSAYRIYI